MRRPLLLGLLLLSLGLGPRAAAANELGARVYRQSCATCHGSGGEGDGPVARHLVPPPADLTAGRFALRSTPWHLPPTDEDLARTVRRGIPGTSMPGFETLLSHEQIEAVVAHVKTLSTRWEAGPAPAVPAPAVPEDLISRAPRGEELYRQACTACHGAAGRGDGPAAGAFVDAAGRPAPPRDFRREAMRGGARPEDLFRTLTAGMEGTAMPPFAHLPEEDRWALVAYLRTLLPARVPHRVGVDPKPAKAAR